MKKLSLILIGALIFSTSCKQINVEPEAYFVFGHFFGFCEGETCIEMFKIENEMLYEDINDTYPNPNEAYVGDWQLLSTEKYEMVRDLQDNVPEALLEIPNGVIGAPDAADGGGLYIEIYEEDLHHFWYIDFVLDNIPDGIRDFVEAAKAKVRALE